VLARAPNRSYGGGIDFEGTDLRSVAAGVAVIVFAWACLACFAARAHAAAGDLDPGFGAGGVALTDFDIDDGADAVALQPDGKIVGVGRVFFESGANDAFVYRLNPDGSPDTSFSHDGKTTLDVSIHDDAYAVAVQPDGKIVVAGGSDGDAWVYRLNTDGSPDLGFDGDGVTKLDFGGKNETARAVAIRPDGKIVVLGDTANAATPNDIAVWRLTTTGGLDSTFDADGLATVDTGGNDQAAALALRPDGKIVIAGTQDFDTITVYRLLANGAPANTLNDARDPTYDADGLMYVSYGAGVSARALALRPDGKIVVAGTLGGPTQIDGIVARLQPNGATSVDDDGLDHSFDGDGVAVIDTGTRDFLRGLALQPDGKVVVSGAVENGMADDAVVWRLQPNGGPGQTNGAFDTSFSGDGTALIDRGAANENMGALAVQPDRRIVGVGRVGTDAATYRLFGDPFQLTVSKTGRGSVTSAPAGIACGAVCAHPFDDGTRPTLTATPAADWRFAGFSGSGCSGKGPCAVTMTADRAVSASFVPAAFGAKTLVTLKLAKRRIRAKGPLPVRVTNRNGFSVRGRLSGKTVAKVAASRLRRVKLRAKAFTVGAHKRKTVKLRLPRALRLLLEDQGKLTLRVTAKVKDPAGHTRRVKKRVKPRLKPS